jgi:Reverse transcriptase (RNA-dependent DNA polymerase)
MCFDVKFDGRRKSRLVAQGNKTIVPAEDVYSGAVGIDSVRLILALGAMDDYKVCAGDIGNAFLYGRNKERTMITAGPEFGESLRGTVFIVQGGWYGHKSAAATFD